VRHAGHTSIIRRQPTCAATSQHGTISEKDISLVRRTDSVDEAYEWLVKDLTEHMLKRPGAIL